MMEFVANLNPWIFIGMGVAVVVSSLVVILNHKGELPLAAAPGIIGLSCLSWITVFFGTLLLLWGLFHLWGESSKTLQVMPRRWFE